jgi:GNAT superfamily N-acetyltransferase
VRHGLVTLERGCPADLPDAVAIDEDACLLYSRAGLVFRLPADHPFLTAEADRWRRCAELGGLWFASRRGGRVGFAALGEIDGLRHLDQLAVHTSAQRAGIGRALVSAMQGIAAAERRSLVLTTYDHLPWNAPFYGTCGFRRLDAGELGPGLRRAIEAERAALPRADLRVAMRWDPVGAP